MNGGRGTLARLVREERQRLRDTRFWIVQALVLALAGLHVSLEIVLHARSGAALYFLPEALFLLPVGYAALNFGRRGAVLTAWWSTLLALPNVVLWHRGEELQGALVQLVIVNAIALFVGQRVDQERRARRQVEEARQALAASEQGYRTLFETSAEPVLVFNQRGVIRQANRAAGDLFGRGSAEFPGLTVHALLGAEGGRRLLDGRGQARDGEIVLSGLGRPAIYLEPICTPLSDAGGEGLIQAVLRDVTQERRRRRELATYAGYMLRAQEDERRRIAQELHDEVLQSLILLLRRLDAAEESASPALVSGPLQTARVLAEELVVRIREFTGQLRPPALEGLGLLTSAQRMLDDLAARAPLRAGLTVEGEPRRLESELELGLFRIAQEALRNAERHAQATAVTMTVRFSPDEVSLQVQDDGRGFDYVAAGYRLIEMRSFGLLGMQERAALLGGRLIVDAAPGRGTVITVTIPAPSAGPDAELSAPCT